MNQSAALLQRLVGTLNFYAASIVMIPFRQIAIIMLLIKVQLYTA